jgi:DNA-binding transcriptional LysR family regulator
VTLQQDMDKLNRFITRTKSSGARLTVSMTRFSHTAECFNDICSKYDDQENLFLRMHECSTMDVIESVLNGYSGIGVLHFSASESALMKRNFEIKKLSFRQIGSFRPYVCLSKDHPLLQSGTVEELDIRDLLSYGFVRYIGQYEDFLYHIATENGVVDLNESSRIIFVNDRAGQMRLISETNYYTIGIPEFEFQDALYDVVSVPLKNCSDHICFGILTKKEWRPSPIERDFTDTVCRKYASLSE